MRALVLALLFIPTLAAAKYEGGRQEREPLTIAIVFASQHPTRYITDARTLDIGLHDLLRAALEVVHTSGAGQISDHVAYDADVAMPVPGSQAILIGYDTGARVIATVALDALRGDSLGPAAQYRGRTGNDLVAGLELALVELAKSPNTRRALIVIGDGGDPNLAMRGQLASFADRAYAFRTRVYALRWLESTSMDENQLPLLTHDWEPAHPLEATLPALIRRIARTQPAIERTSNVARPVPRPVPWFWLGVGAIAVAIAVAIWWSRPRATA